MYKYKDEIDNRLDAAKEQTSHLDVTAIEAVPNETQSEIAQEME